MKEHLIDRWKREYNFSKELLKAFDSVPREKFILPQFLDDAYGDYPLPINYEQTISQPTTVMMMIDWMELKKTDKVLEVGAGSGYCAAIMSKLCKKVITTEMVPQLADFAKKNLEKAGIENAEVVEWDGSQGYEKQAPYDRIMVTAGCPSIPKPLIDQLKDSGILIAPVESFLSQVMVRIRKDKGKLEKEKLGAFSFVPLRGKFGHKFT